MRRLFGPLIAAVILIGIGVALGIAYSGSRPSAQSPAVTVLTVPVLITATTDPNATPLVRVVTATPPAGVVVLPTGIIPTDGDAESTVDVDAPTVDPAILDADAALQQTATALPEGCILHTIAEGDTPFAVAETYGASGFDLMEINGLTDETAVALQIGDVLIVPLPGCSLTAEDVAASIAGEEVTEEVTEEATAESTEDATTPTRTPTVRPTLTLPPTAANAQLEIVRVINPGDITAEGVEIRNNGAAVNLTGWTLSDSEGNTFTFPEQRLFTGGVVTVYTRIGTNTPILLYWGRNEAVWEEGDTVTLEDAVGTVQSSTRIE